GTTLVEVILVEGHLAPSIVKVLPLGTMRFENDQVAAIMGYGDYQIGNVTISKPNCQVTRDWSHDMIMYFKRAWEADRENERLDQEVGMERIVEGIVEDVLEDDSLATKNLVAKDLQGIECNLLN
nr:hypothetical protein [Tanacetum cinerariifolium]GFA82856.1 hypothetical protein [Tanacetum cinerariifolium]